MEKFIPSTQDKGFFSVAEPFAIPPNEVYTCKAIRTLSEMISLGMDPYQLYYAPYNLELSEYTLHQENDMEIISLLNDGGKWVHFPASYLLGYPNMNGIPYRSVAIQVRLPPFPVGHDFGFVETQVKDTVQQALGVQAESVQVITSKTKLIDSGKHELKQAERVSLSKGTTPSARAAYWQSAFEALQEKYDALVNSMT